MKSRDNDLLTAVFIRSFGAGLWSVRPSTVSYSCSALLFSSDFYQTWNGIRGHGHKTDMFAFRVYPVYTLLEKGPNSAKSSNNFSE